MPIQPVPVLPVVQVAPNVWFKRDDVYKPFADTDMNGAKTYQCLNLIASHLDVIRQKHGSTVYSDNFLESPQGPIVARVAHEYNLRCIIPVAADSLETALRHRSMQLVQSWGGEVVPVCKMGFALKSRATKLYGNKYFRVRFGMSSDSPTVQGSVVDPVRKQAQAFLGLPTETMTLVVAVGSGVAFASLLVGMADHNVRFKRVVGVQIAGYDRTDTVSRIVTACGYGLAGDEMTALGFFQTNTSQVHPFDFVEDTQYPYAQQVERTIGGVTLDSQYEAKAWDWAVREGVTKSPMVFYVVGNSNCLR